MNTAYLSLGSNIGDRLQQLSDAKNGLLNEDIRIMVASSIYETAAWGSTDQASFLNQVIKVECTYTANELMQILLKIELKMGRVRTIKNASRNIDIDILFFNDQIINTRDVTVPHPEIANRRFILVPLTEIASNKIHPSYNRTMKDLLHNCKDNLDVKYYPGA